MGLSVIDGLLASLTGASTRRVPLEQLLLQLLEFEDTEQAEAGKHPEEEAFGR